MGNVRVASPKACVTVVKHEAHINFHSISTTNTRVMNHIAATVATTGSLASAVV